MSQPPRVRLVIFAGTAIAMLAGGVMFLRANARTNKSTLASRPKGVTAVPVREASYRPSRRYIGTIQPWLQARMGPQLTSAYVATVLVRPGDAVKRGQVLATLDCRGASAQSQAVAMQARALEAKREALSHESTRVSGLVDGGFVSANEAEQKSAESAAKQAELLATQARLSRASLEVDDCILRAPFDGEVAERWIDPGAFARPATPVVSIVDRNVVRITADVPESDFAFVAPGSLVQVKVLATGQKLAAKIARRSPAADSSTRTIHFELDVPDTKRQIPVGTTAELAIDVGEATPAIELPLIAASVRGGKATLFVLDGNRAKKRVVPVKGEQAGLLFLEPQLAAGTLVVTEGRSILKEDDVVNAKRESEPVAGVKP